MARPIVVGALAALMNTGTVLRSMARQPGSPCPFAGRIPTHSFLTNLPTGSLHLVSIPSSQRTIQRIRKCHSRSINWNSDTSGLISNQTQRKAWRTKNYLSIKNKKQSSGSSIRIWFPSWFSCNSKPSNRRSFKKTNIAMSQSQQINK